MINDELNNLIMSIIDGDLKRVPALNRSVFLNLIIKSSDMTQILEMIDIDDASDSRQNSISTVLEEFGMGEIDIFLHLSRGLFEKLVSSSRSTFFLFDCFKRGVKVIDSLSLLLSKSLVGLDLDQHLFQLLSSFITRGACALISELFQEPFPVVLDGCFTVESEVTLLGSLQAPLK